MHPSHDLLYHHFTSWGFLTIICSYEDTAAESLLSTSVEPFCDDSGPANYRSLQHHLHNYHYIGHNGIAVGLDRITVSGTVNKLQSHHMSSNAVPDTQMLHSCYDTTTTPLKVSENDCTYQMSQSAASCSFSKQVNTEETSQVYKSHHSPPSSVR